MKLPDVQIRKILYATDLSENAVYAFAYAVSLANLYCASITTLHVLSKFSGEEFAANMISAETLREIKRRHYEEAKDDLLEEQRDLAAVKEILEAFCEEAKNAGENQNAVTDEVLIKSGQPAEEIVETARKKGCDLIVMGTHGQGVIADVLVGSTARWVIRHSAVPVLVVRLP